MDDTFESYNGDDDPEEEQSSPELGGDEEPETDTGEEEGDSYEGDSNPVGQPTSKGYIYFLESDDARFIKIGFSKNVINRIADLGTVMPLKLIGCLPGSIKTERYIHRRFLTCRKTGEWFYATSALREYIHQLKLTRPDSNNEQNTPLLLGTLNRRLQALHKRKPDLTWYVWDLPGFPEGIATPGKYISVPLDPCDLLCGACDWVRFEDITADQLDLYLDMIDRSIQEENTIKYAFRKLRSKMDKINDVDTDIKLFDLFELKKYYETKKQSSVKQESDDREK